MYKEFAAGCLILFILYFICKKIVNRTPGLFSMITWSTLGLCVILQIGYNYLFLFPDYYMETIGGTLRFGTFSENLLAYNNGWDFRDEILQPILKNRSIKVDNSAPYYHDYFKLLAKTYASESYDAEDRNAVLSHASDFDFVTRFETFRIMDYVKDPYTVPKELRTMLENEVSPNIHIHMNSIKAEDSLICLVMPNYSLYILGENQLAAYTTHAENNLSAPISTEGGSALAE